MLGDLVESMKTAALEAVENSDPCCILYGMVIQAEPLRIQVNQKLILDAECLVLTRNVTDFTTEVTVSWSTESALSSHSHGASISGTTGGYNLAHTHSITGRKSITVHNSLVVGEEVILIRQAGGQEYIVLDRVGVKS